MKSSFTIALFLVLTIIALAVSKDAYEWRSRSIYQVITDRYARTDPTDDSPCDLWDYCGGTFVGLKNKLPYIASMGFDALWISPVVENTEKGYHGYWASDFYKINSHFGTADELKDLIKTAHDMNIWVMFDVAVNHVGPIGDNFTEINPFNESSHYHENCDISDWSNQTQVELCRFMSLPDLNQDNPYVRETLKSWIKWIVDEFDFDGIRIDGAPQITKDFWIEFAEAGGVIQIGEIAQRRYDFVGSYQGALHSLLNYPLHYKFQDMFGYKNESMTNFTEHYKNMTHFRDQDVLGNFVDNHDRDRFLHFRNNTVLFRTVLAFVLCSRGIPITYYGSELDFSGGRDPANREPFWDSNYAHGDNRAFLTRINKARKVSQWYNEAQVERYVDTEVYAFSRGRVFFAFTNEPDINLTKTVFTHPYKLGDVVCDILQPESECITIEKGGLQINIKNGEVKILVQKAVYDKLSEDKIKSDEL